MSAIIRRNSDGVCRINKAKESLPATNGAASYCSALLREVSIPKAFSLR